MENMVMTKLEKLQICWLLTASVAFITARPVINDNRMRFGVLVASFIVFWFIFSWVKEPK